MAFPIAFQNNIQWICLKIDYSIIAFLRSKRQFGGSMGPLLEVKRQIGGIPQLQSHFIISYIVDVSVSGDIAMISSSTSLLYVVC